jgi:hypothetical protein
MGYRAAANCQHLDNWRRCRVHTASPLIRWLMPGGRPPCVFDMEEPQDGRIVCEEQAPYPRPAGPPPMPRKH